MSSRSLTILLAAILLLSFFLPYVSYRDFYMITISGWEIIFDTEGDSFIRGMIILVAASALLLLIFALTGEKYSIPRKLLVWLPILSVIACAVYILTNFLPYSGNSPILITGELLSLLGTGFWITLIVAILLPVLKGKPASPGAPAES